jgi:hypothetical protein
MALTAGSVTITSDGRTGSGMAVAIYDKLIATKNAVNAMGGALGKMSDREGLAEYAVAIAEAVVAYITANAAVSGTAQVTSQSLGRAPNPNNAGAAIQAPASPVSVPVTGTVG